MTAAVDIERVYCLVRARNPEEAMDRVLQSLKKYRVLSAAATNKITALPSDFSKDTLGLAARTWKELQSTVTCVIHCAWAVNFNLDVRSFEEQHIRGSKNLINFCLGSPRPIPPSFNFVSSISAAAGIRGPVMPEVLPGLDQAPEMGYARSKIITEHICQRAHAQTGLRTRILRIGQIVGDTKHGIWNEKEAWPLTVQAAVTVGALPVIVNGDEELSWLPVDTTAAAVVELSLATGTPPHAIFHIANPHLLWWNADFVPALRKAGLRFEALRQDEWVERLASNQDGLENPPVKLLEYFKAKYGRVRKGQAKERKMGMANALRHSETLREAGGIDDALIGKFLLYWMGECWASPVVEARL
jgi:thioester reductase-like protein